MPRWLKAGSLTESTDPEFDDYSRKFTTMEETVEKLLKECKKFNEAVVCELIHDLPIVSDYASHLSALLSKHYSPLVKDSHSISHCCSIHSLANTT